MKALLLVAHGSRIKQSNDEVLILAEKLKISCSQRYSIVQAAFLELAEMKIPDGIKQCVTEGATSIIVLPYFLNSGKHVVEDIPNVVSECQAYYPNVSIAITPHIGASELMLDLLISQSNSTVN